MGDTDSPLEPPEQQDPESAEESTALIQAEKHAKLEKLEEIISAIPVQEKQDEARLILRDFTKIIERPSQIDPETARIITESVDKDNERRFQYLSQKQRDKTELDKEELKFRRDKHKDGFSIIKPVVIFALIIVSICVITGIWLCANGKETLGASLITGSLSAVLSFAAGFGTGTSSLFKDDKQ